MSLLAILFSLAIERYVNAIEQLRNLDWSISFADWVKEKFSHSEFWNDTLGLVVIILLPVFLCAIIYSQLYDVMGLLGFLFAVVVLVYSMGPKRIHHTARYYLDAGEHEDEHSLKTYAAELLDNDVPDDEQETHRRISEKLLVGTNESLLAVFFWFVLLGPMGALMFRITDVLYENTKQQQDESDYTEFNNSVRMLYAILLWIPTQLTTLAFAITGSFIDTLHEWQSRIHNDYLNPMESADTLFHTGLKALQLDADHPFDVETVHDVLQLCWRSIILWVTILALLTLAGWAG